MPSTSDSKFLCVIQAAFWKILRGVSSDSPCWRMRSALAERVPFWDFPDVQTEIELSRNHHNRTRDVTLLCGPSLFMSLSSAHSRGTLIVAKSRFVQIRIQPHHPKNSMSRLSPINRLS